MMDKKIFYFRVDSGPQVGMGHFYRCFSLAIALKQNHEVTFFLNYESTRERELLELESIQAVFTDRKSSSEFIEALTVNQIVVIDGYAFSQELHMLIKSKGCLLVHIDDLAAFYQVADVVINHSANATQLTYKTAPYTKLLLGSEYVLLRPFFMQQHTPSTNNNILDHVVITMGGADEHDLTSKFASFCLKSNLFGKISVVLGPLYNNQPMLEKAIAGENVNVYTQLDEKEMGKLLLSSTVVICPASGTLHEALSLNCLCIAGISAANQLTNYQGLAEKEVFIPSGDLQKTSFNDFNLMIQKLTPQLREQILKNSSYLFDKKSISRILNVFEQLME